MCELDVKSGVYVNVVPLPIRVKALVKAIPDGELILINDFLSDEAKREALDHELRHIRQGDLFNGKPIQEVEFLGGNHGKSKEEG